MTSSQFLYFTLLFFLIMDFAAAASSSSISNDALGTRGSTGRSLLQAKKSCPEDMESKNYTIITSKCKGPQYPAKGCCDALKEFACPFAEALNDLTNDCAETMFSYINLYGKYPPGLFANQCKEGKDGLSCDQVVSAKVTQSQKSTAAATHFSQLLMLAAIFLLTLFYFF